MRAHHRRWAGEFRRQFWNLAVRRERFLQHLKGFFAQPKQEQRERQAAVAPHQRQIVKVFAALAGGNHAGFQYLNNSARRSRHHPLPGQNKGIKFEEKRSRAAA